MATTLTIDDETAALLRERAATRGVTPEAYVRELVLGPAPPLPVEAAETRRPMTTAEREQWWRELAKGSENIPPLPADFSRRDIYEEPD